MNLRNLTRLFGSWFLVIALAAFAVGGLVFLSMARNGSLPSYSAEAVVAVGGDVYRDAQDTAYVELSSTMLDNYLEVATMGVIVDPVIARLGLTLTSDEFVKLVDVSSIEGTNLITIRVSHTDPVMAADIANGIASQLTSLAPARWTNFVMLMESADVPDQPDIFALLPVVLSSLLGALLVAGVILFREFLRDPLYNEQMTQDFLGLPVVAILEPKHFFAVRHLFNREWLRSADSVLWSLKETCLKSSHGSVVDEWAPFIVLTSPDNSSQSLAAVRLAAAWSKEADEVILADLDLEQKRATSLSLNFQPQEGFATLIRDPEAKLDDLLISNSIAPALRVLPAGALVTPPKPDELKTGLNSFQAQRRAGVPLIVSAPEPDSSVMIWIAGRLADVNLLVIDAQTTPRVHVRRAINALAAHDVIVRGVILSYVSFRSLYWAQRLRQFFITLKQRFVGQPINQSRPTFDERKAIPQ